MRRTCSGLVFLFVTCVSLQAQDVISSASSEGASSVPISLTHGKPFVRVMVNGKGPYRFVIDTGTGGEAFVSAELADDLKLPVVGQIRVSDPSKQGGQKVPIVLIQSLEVAGVAFTSVKAVRHTLSTADGNCDGILGFELFKNYLLTLDYPNRRMTLESGVLAPDGEHSVLHFRMPDGIPIVPLQVGNIQIDAQIDSGGTGLSLPAKIMSGLRFESDPTIFGVGQSMSTRFELKAAKLASDVHLGSYVFSRPFVEINSAFPLANFGSCALKDFVLTFDQKDGLVRFESSRQVLHLAATPTQVNMERAPVDAQPQMSLVPVG